MRVLKANHVQTAADTPNTRTTHRNRVCFAQVTTAISFVFQAAVISVNLYGMIHMYIRTGRSQDCSGPSRSRPTCYISTVRAGVYTCVHGFRKSLFPPVCTGQVAKHDGVYLVILANCLGASICIRMLKSLCPSIAWHARRRRI